MTRHAKTIHTPASNLLAPTRPRGAAQTTMAAGVWRASFLGLALALAGCVSSNQTVTGPAAKADSNVGPGTAAADEDIASMIFSDVCLDSAPSFRKAPEILAGMPFRQRPETETYYHQTLDLSVKLMPKRCSMVFGSTSDPMQLGLRLAVEAGMKSGSNDIGIDPDTGASATKGPKGTHMEFTRLPLRTRYPLYRAVLIAP